MSLKIKSFIAGDGERFSQIYSSHEPWPLFYPTAFISRSIRLSTTPTTQLGYLEAIKRLLEWVDACNIDLETRFRCDQFLRPHEIDGLARHLNAARRAKPGHTISGSKGNTYVSYAAQYLKWLADELITDAYRPKVKNMIDRQHTGLIDKLISKPGSRSAKKLRMLNKQLHEQAKAQLEALWNEPFGELFRSADRGSRLRTVVMLRILYETGMRRGELLALKLKILWNQPAGLAHAWQSSEIITMSSTAVLRSQWPKPQDESYRSHPNWKSNLPNILPNIEPMFLASALMMKTLSL